MGLFDSIIGTSPEEAEPLGEENISNEVAATGWTGTVAGDDSSSGNGGGGSGTGDDSSSGKKKKTETTVDTETPNIDIGGDLNFSPESEKIEEAAKSSFLDMSEPNDTIVENIVDITTPEAVDPISIMSIENTPVDTPKTENNIESTEHTVQTTEILESTNNTLIENTSSEGATFGEKIAQFLGGLNILRESDEEKIKKIETKISSLKEELKKNQEELKKIQADEKKIDDTITMINNVK